ncbi:MAG: sulfite exporter TauE/SafE family protein [Aquificaceae bacterium]
MGEFVGFALLGFFIAFAIGLTGVGAGTLTAPTLIMFGLDPSKAVGSALTFSALVKFPAGLLHFILENIDVRILKNMLFGALPGVFIGSYLLSKISLIQDLKNSILLIIGITIILSILLNLLFIFKNKRIDLTKYSYLLPFACFLIGLEVGFTSAGAGALGMVLLLYFTSLEASKCVGTDISFGLACSLVGSGFHMLLGNTQINILVPMGLGGLVGIWLGTRLTRKINPRPLRLIISVLLFFVAINLIQRGLS